MRLSIQLGALLVAFVMLLAACTPGAAPTATPGATPVTTPADTPAATPEGTPDTTPEATPDTTPDATPDATPDGGEPSPEPSPSPAPGAEEGTLVIWAAGETAQALTDIGATFSQEFNVPVQVYELGFGDIRDQLLLRGPAGEGPDIIIGAHDWLGQLTAAGVVEPLDLGEKADQFAEVGLDAFTYEGTLYGMPYGSEAIALYFNRDLMPDGEPPATWEEMQQIARDLEGAGTVEQGYCLQKGDPYHSYPILSGHGGYIFGPDDVGAYNPEDVGLDSPGGLAYANELNDLVAEGLLRDNVGYGECITMMTTGQAAFWITGPWALADFRESGINYGVAPIPMMEEQPRPFVGVQGMMVSAFAPNMLLAQSFLTEYIATDEAMAALLEADPRLPVWLPLAETVDDPDIAAFTESASHGDPMPAIPEMSAVWEHWTTAINLVFEQAQDPEEAFSEAADRIREAIDQP